MDAEIRRLGADRPTSTGYLAFVAPQRAHLRQGVHRAGGRPLSAPVGHGQDRARSASAWRATAPSTASSPRHVQDERLRQVLSFHPLLVGGNPFQTTSIYTLIHYLEREWGVWFAMGGTGAIVAALVRLLGELGGALRLERRGRQILTERTAGRPACADDGRGAARPTSSSATRMSPAPTQRLLPAASAQEVHRPPAGPDALLDVAGRHLLRHGPAVPRRRRPRAGPPRHHPRPALRGAAGRHLHPQDAWPTTSRSTCTCRR